MNLRNGQITVNEVLSNPRARMLLQREIPMIMGHPMLRMAGNMTLTQVLRYAGGRVPQDQINRILEELKAI